MLCGSWPQGNPIVCLGSVRGAARAALVGVCAILGLAATLAAWAQDGPAQARDATSQTLAGSMPTPTTTPTTTLVAAPNPADAPAQPVSAEAPVRVANRTVAVFRSPFLGMSPQERARRTEGALRDGLAAAREGRVTVEVIPQGRVVMIDGSLAIVLTPGDADPIRGETLEAVAQRAARTVELLVAESREARDTGLLLRAAGMAAAATVVAFGAAWALWWLRAAFGRRLAALAQRQAQRLQVGGTALVLESRVEWLVSRLVSLGYWVLMAILLVEWLAFVLERFPYTRPWGEQLIAYVAGVAARIGGAMLDALPDLFVAVVIFLLARLSVRTLARVFERVESGQFRFGWLDRDTTRMTRRLVSAGVWLFALAMAYPYLPGSSTEAFKGVSVLVGLMLSLGASSIVGQAASGLILMYTHTLRVGEFVRIGDSEGTLIELGLFSARIRTGLGEELTLPNSMIIGNVTRNYSRAVHGHGFIVDTTVTIGYDTPWRQVEAMLVAAALRTPGVLASPPPRVFQIGLSDWYPEYRLVCQAVPTEPRPRAEVMSMLHANVQDVFNEYGVQIMSPHYFTDPADAKTVPPSRWYAAPAVAPPAGPAAAGAAAAMARPPGAAPRAGHLPSSTEGSQVASGGNSPTATSISSPKST